MRLIGVVDLPTGMGVGDHAYWAYGDADRYRAQVVLYLAEGRESGDRLWYVGHQPRAQLIEDLELLAARDEMLHTGRLRVLSAEELYGPPGRLDVAATLATFATEAARAVKDGYRSLRIATDVTGLASPDGLVSSEVLCERLTARAPLTLLCAYEEAWVGTSGRAIASVHPLQHGAETPTMFGLHWEGDAFCLRGEADASTSQDLGTAVAAAVYSTEKSVVLDLSNLRFIDIAATRVLAQVTVAAQFDGRGIWFRSPRPPVRRCLEVFDLLGRVVP